MPQLVDRGFIGSNRPWDDPNNVKKRHKATAGSSLHYRGWVLVDLLNGRYARKGLEKVRICDFHMPQSDALKAFHDAVDRIEGEE